MPVDICEGLTRHRRDMLQCPLLAQSGHADALNQCPLLGVKRTSVSPRSRNGRYGISDSALLRPNVGRPDHLGPLLSFVGDKLAEVRRRACEYRAAEISDPHFHLGIGESRIDLLVEYVDDLGGRTPGCADARPSGSLIPG